MIAGITGHQNLGDENTISWINDCLTQEIQNYKISKGITSLALGADQLFAQILTKLNIPYIAVVPCDKYELTFEHKSMQENYFAYLSKAEEIIRLKFSIPGEIAFYEAGKYVVDHADILMAIWNGKAARGLGGTGDEVKYGKIRKKKIIHINPNNRKVRILI